MKKEVRENIIFTMYQFYDLKALAVLPDKELLEQYKKMCDHGECDVKEKK